MVSQKRAAELEYDIYEQEIQEDPEIDSILSESKNIPSTDAYLLDKRISRRRLSGQQLKILEVHFAKEIYPSTQGK